MKLKKIAAMLMAGVMCIGLMAGCGSSDKNAQTDSTDPKDRTQLTVGFDAEFPPYEYYESDEITGLDVDFAQAICDKLGMELEVEDMAFDSIIPAVNSGKADMGVAGMTVTPDREKEVLFSDSYYSSKQVIIVKDDFEE